MHWKRVAKVLVFGAISFFIGLNIYHGWLDASRFRWDVRPWPLAVSFVLALAFWLTTGLAWNLLMAYLGGSLSLRKGLRIYFLSNLGWYVPGKVWYAVGRAYLGQQEGVSVGIVTTSMLVEVVLSLISSALMATLALPLLSPLLGTKGLYLGIAVLVLGLTILHPALMKRLLALLERFLPGSKPEMASPPEYSVMLSLLAGYLVIWSLVGAAFFILLNAVYPLRLGWFPTVIAIYSVSWMAGFLAPFAPSGLGVREGTMILLLGRYLPVPAVTATAVLFRIWLILAEMIWAAVATRW